MERDTLALALRKYARAEVIEASFKLLEKLGQSREELTSYEVAKAIYLACSVQEKQRTLAALAIQRKDSSESLEVQAIESKLLAPDISVDCGVPTSVMRDLSRLYFGHAELDAKGHAEGVNVRGGATRNWVRIAMDYMNGKE